MSSWNPGSNTPNGPDDPNEGQPTPPPPGYGQQPPPYGQQPPSYPQYPNPGQQPPGQQPPGQPPYGSGYGYPAAPPPPPGGGYGPPPAPVPGGRRASMGNRFGGLVVDTIIVAVIAAIIAIPFGAYKHHGGSFNSSQTKVDLIALVVGLAYYGFFVGVQGQTIGHRAASIRVVDVNNGGVIGVGRAMLRWVVLAISGAICTLGYWTPFFDSQRRQGWHDKAASAVVIPTR
jgi:uncharacterized RDD family membrane protein YckC